MVSRRQSRLLVARAQDGRDTAGVGDERGAREGARRVAICSDGTDEGGREHIHRCVLRRCL